MTHDKTKGLQPEDVKKDPKLQGCLHLADYIISLQEQGRLPDGGDDEGKFLKAVEEDLEYIHADMDAKGIV